MVSLTPTTPGLKYLNHREDLSASGTTQGRSIDHNTLLLSDYPVALMGDLNGDHVNDILDVVPIGLAWHSYPGGPNRNVQADLNGDGYINILDIVRIMLRAPGLVSNRSIEPALHRLFF